MRLLSRYLYITLAMLIAVCYILFKQWNKERNNAIRWEENTAQIENYYKGELSQLKLTQQEFNKSMADSTKELIKQLAIKPKKIVEYVTIYQRQVDTVFVETKLKELNDSTYSFTDNSNCFTIEGLVYTKDPETKVNIIRKEYNNTLQYFLYQKRRVWAKPLGIKINLFGKKYTDLKIVSTCGESQVKRVEIIKN